MSVEIRDTLQLGRLIRRARKAAGMTQIELARKAAMGERFIVDLEHGKPTCEAGRVLRVMTLLNLRLAVEAPAGVTQEVLERDAVLPAPPRKRPQKPPSPQS
jgi:y4mF family transcriptional regulator